MTILVCGGDSVDAIKQQAAAAGYGYVEHWSGRKTRSLGKPIPKDTVAVVVVLDRISHSLARKVRTESAHRGLPVFFQKRGRHRHSTDPFPTDFARWLNRP